MITNKKITIIGAGISGLIAALELEKAGVSPTIIESTDRVGGRVKTDRIEGYQLDHGFQVLLEAYPKAKKYLNYKHLNLQKIKPGAVIFKNGTQTTIGDPLRDMSLLIPTLLAKVGSIKDKLAILKLNIELKNKSIDEIFEAEQITTLQYLKHKGFSDRIIKNFFKPFFSGIFLETELRTSSVMFQFVYKMFGEGLAVIPKSGIEAIPYQLLSQLKNTNILYNTKVKRVEDKRIILDDDSVINTDLTIIATEASKLLKEDKNISWKSCDTIYFEVDKNTLKKPIIGLIADDNALINNIFFTTSIATNTTNTSHLLSVTVVKSHTLNETELINTVKSELKTHCNISTKRCIKRYQIKQALPDLKQVSHSNKNSQYTYSDSIYLAGDTLLNGSLNAAMSSGEAVAKLIINN
ncbi:NAD(P)/FAD-dependent oxidoreductase [Olleya sp. YS]|uniref:NAD(P)/FAD-dependent oxidoreductase n=1 Tax=Olleya sp. YS TaxID=3028318 RepID=UPI00243419ED|nr:NAD(P)/FAD-dependent oxidoreductase [Olleya sp. YS]WGD34519.1 NAD(P)/FAD-dependent oxidoreductase [Olleya sp. YS]